MNLHFTPLPIRQIKRTNEISQVKGDEPHRTLEHGAAHAYTWPHTSQREKSLDLGAFFTFSLCIKGEKNKKLKPFDLMMQLIQTENMAIFGNQSMKKFPAGGLELDQSKRLKGNIYLRGGD